MLFDPARAFCKQIQALISTKNLKREWSACPKPLIPAVEPATLRQQQGT